MSSRTVPAQGDFVINPDAFAARHLDVLQGLLGWDATINDYGGLMFALSELRSDSRSTSVVQTWLAVRFALDEKVVAGVAFGPLCAVVPPMVWSPSCPRRGLLHE